MCGIAGLVSRSTPPHRLASDVRAMCDAIRHRGPDDDGYYASESAAIGMRRLSIIDVAGGAQPIANENGTIHVVFNGEIYNHRALRRRLECAGHRFRTQSDTETLVHLYEERGDALTHELRGMFAFAIWDAPRGRLLLARDRIGIKPLYYWAQPDGLAFASELRSLLALRTFPARLNRAGIAQYLALGYVPDPHSVFEGAYKLPPGHVLSWSADEGVQVATYWSPTRIPTARIEAREATEELRRLIADAVGSHLESEVPLGAFLSGGIDSSTVVAQMARLMDRPVHTFSIGFDDPQFNEAPDARVVAESIRTVHTEFIVRPAADQLVEQVVRAFDEPFADSSALATYLVSGLAREQVTVALSGDGGDELLGGYTRYAQVARAAELHPPALRRAVRSAAVVLPHGAPGRNRLIDLTRSKRGRFTATVALALAVEEGGVARDDTAALVPRLDGLLAPQFDGAAGRDFVTQMTLVDLQTYLPGDVLTKVDRMTMATSLEARVPLLDHTVVEFALSLPGTLKLRDGVGKWVLREAVRGLIPDRPLQKRKQGFAVPLRHWFRRELSYRLERLARSDALIGEYVDGGAVGRVVREHRDGRRDHATALWRLLVLELWLEALRAGDLARPSHVDGLTDVLRQTSPV